MPLLAADGGAAVRRYGSGGAFPGRARLTGEAGPGRARRRTVGRVAQVGVAEGAGGGTPGCPAVVLELREFMNAEYRDLVDELQLLADHGGGPRPRDESKAAAIAALLRS